MANYVLLRTLVGGALLLELVLILPFAQRMLGRAWDPGSPLRGRGSTAAVVSLWVAACLGLVFDVATLASALVAWAMCRYFFVHVRFRSLLRGAGAVGFVPYMVAGHLVLWELAFRVGAPPAVVSALTWWFCIDFGLMLCCAATSKLTMGYLAGHGVELALVNPFWGRWWRLLRRLPANHQLFHLQNLGAGGVQLLAGVLVIIPATRPVGAVLWMGMFAYILATLRLGALPVISMLIPVALLPELGLGGPPPVALWSAPAWAMELAAAVVWAWVALHLATKAVQYLNFYANQALPQPLQRAFDAVGGALPVFIWRVFTADVASFYLRVEVVSPEGRTLEPLRFRHVGESVALSVLFGALKYSPDQRQDFEPRLLRYTRALQLPPGHTVRFVYLRLVKEESRFVERQVGHVHVDLASEAVEVTRTDPVLDFDTPVAPGVVRPCRALGSYLPER